MTWKHTLNFYFCVCDNVAKRNICSSHLKNKVRETYPFLDDVLCLSTFLNNNIFKIVDNNYF